MNVLDLFSGIGGFSLGLERAGMKTVAFCEIDEYCQHVIHKNFPARPIFSDIRTLTKGRLSELGINRIDVVTGGFPCQGFSIAGKKKGINDHRDLWPEMFRVIKETRPSWVIGENVANFVNMAFARSKTDMESIGYTVRPFIIPACAVGAQHRRDRVWIIAHFNGDRLGGEANASAEEDDQREREGHGWPEAPAPFGHWFSDQSGVGRAVYGVSDRVDPYRKERVAALGNSVVPQIPEIIGRSIMEFEEAHDLQY